MLLDIGFPAPLSDELVPQLIVSQGQGLFVAFLCYQVIHLLLKNLGNDLRIVQLVGIRLGHIYSKALHESLELGFDVTARVIVCLVMEDSHWRLNRGI